jgi:DNA-binding response OmpR family regulator
MDNDPSVELPKKVLIVEDDVDFSNILVDKLSQENYDVRQVADGDQVMSLVLDFRPDLILLDLLLPKLGGFEILERLRTYPDTNIVNTPVIVLSNLRSDRDISQAQSLKVNNYLVKTNTDIDEVLSRVKDAFKEI